MITWSLSPKGSLVQGLFIAKWKLPSFGVIFLQVQPPPLHSQRHCAPLGHLPAQNSHLKYLLECIDERLRLWLPLLDHPNWWLHLYRNRNGGGKSQHAPMQQEHWPSVIVDKITKEILLQEWLLKRGFTCTACALNPRSETTPLGYSTTKVF